MANYWMSKRKINIKLSNWNKKNKRLRQQSLNTDEYESWNTEQLIQWIMNLENGRFSKYREILSKNLLDEGVCGKHLSKINVLHIKGWGVKSFEDKDLLIDSITNLINKNQNNDNDQNDIAFINDEEGAMSGGHFK